MSEDPDEIVVVRYQRGDAAAFKVFYFRHRIGTFNYVLSRIRERETAKDLFQEIWIKVARAALVWRPTGSFKSWLYSIARNQCIDYQRKKNRWPTEDHDESAIDNAPVPEVVGDPRLREVIVDCMNKLNEDQREVFFLYMVIGLTFAQITEVMGSAPGLANRRMQLARTHVKRCLATKGITAES